MDIEVDQPDIEQLQQGLNVVGTELANPRNIPVFNLTARLDAKQENMNRNHRQLVETFLRS